MFYAKDDKEYGALVAENRLVADIQMEIERALEAANMSQVDLARLANISEARVSQILSGDGKNLQARTIARLAHVLGLCARVEFYDKAQTCDFAEVHDVDEKFDFKTWLETTKSRGKDFANDDQLQWAA